MKFRRSRNRRPTQNVNIKNQVFDSSGPNGKLRGTAQQLFEKYTTLARDASSGLNADRVLAEGFFQFADHYYRLLLEARLVELESKQPSEQAEIEGQEVRRSENKSNRQNELHEKESGANGAELDERESQAEAEQKSPKKRSRAKAENEGVTVPAEENKDDAKPKSRGRRKKEDTQLAGNEQESVPGQFKVMGIDEGTEQNATL